MRVKQIVPSWEEFCRLARPRTRIPVWAEVIADTETPITLLQKLLAEDGGERGGSGLGGAPGLEPGGCFLLESAERGERVGRYSFVGAGPDLVLTAAGDEVEIQSFSPGAGEKYGLDALGLKDGAGRHAIKGPIDSVLRRAANHLSWAAPAGCPPFCGGAVGYFGYDCARLWEKLPARRDESPFPSAFLMFFERLYIFDHLRRTLVLLANAHIGGEVWREGEAGLRRVYREAGDQLENMASLLKRRPPGSFGSVRAGKSAGKNTEDSGPLPVSSNFTPGEFRRAVERAKEYIRAGDIFQVVLSQKFCTACRSTGLDIYRALRAVNPSPYMFYLNGGGWEIAGSSPEAHVRLEGRRAVVRPIAGTRPRGNSDGEDERLAGELLADPKERAEHVMLVDLARNDLGRVCRYGSVRVEEFMSVERYSHVLHLVSQVSGELREGEDALSLLKATFPAGTVSGAPKIRAMEIIAELEKGERGPYAGALGYISFNGWMDTAIVIRTILKRGEEVSFQAGAGIVAGSVPEREYEETVRKAAALFQVIEMVGGSHNGERRREVSGAGH